VEYGDQRVERGYGGEIHQVASGDSPRLTTQQGIVVSDDQNTLRAGELGPSALEDFGFREKNLPLRPRADPRAVVHARGYGAHGYSFAGRCGLWAGVSPLSLTVAIRL